MCRVVSTGEWGLELQMKVSDAEDFTFMDKDSTSIDAKIITDGRFNP